jgi:hypothetical protein
MVESVRAQPDPDSYIRRSVYAVCSALAAFAFLTSYIHIYDLASANGQRGVAARLLPLSVDVLIVGATLVMYLQRREGGERTAMATFLPRLMLWAGIGGTVAANVASGLPFGPLGAVIAAWPGAVFAGVVEMVIVAVPPRPRGAVNQTVKTAGQAPVPATKYEAAAAAYAESVKGRNPLSEYQLHRRFSIPRSAARKIVTPAASQTPAAAAPSQSPPGDGQPPRPVMPPAGTALSSPEVTVPAGLNGRHGG